MQMGSSGSFGGSGNSSSTDRVYNAKFYNGSSGTQTIDTGMNLTVSGGMILIKDIFNSTSWGVFDTARGVDELLQTDVDSQEETRSNQLTTFTSNGFTLGDYANFNNTGRTFIAYTFKKEEKFFDVVTYTGNGSNRTISHSLNCAVGMIWVKRRDSAGDWKVYHRSSNQGVNNAGYYTLNLNDTSVRATDSTVWNNTEATTTQFSIGTHNLSLIHI